MTSDTLYISDLDGTLLNTKKRISPRSASLLNNLIGRGAAISVASARSLIGIRMIRLDDVDFRVPLVLMNGVMLYDLANHRILQCCELRPDTSAEVLKICAAGGKTPFVYQVQAGRQHITFTGMTSEGERIFYRDRVSVAPEWFQQVERYTPEGVVYFSMQDRFDVLAPVRDRLAELPGVDCVLYPDNYLENNWYLEIFSSEAGKANGVRRLAERLGARRIVAFGDNLNDREMLKTADVACVVRNGVPELLTAADQVIGSNDEDGVAEFIRRDIALRAEIPAGKRG